MTPIDPEVYVFTTVIAAVTAAAGFYAGHRTQINTILRGAAELSPDALALVHQILNRPKGK